MKPVQLHVFDPPMCCSSGVCGPTVDPQLVRFSSDLDWLKKQGVEVRRFNLSSDPGEFTNNSVVRNTIAGEGTKCLPLILKNGVIISKRTYPQRKELLILIDEDDSSDAVGQQVTMPAHNGSSAGSLPGDCGPDCGCQANPRSTLTKSLITGVVVLAVIGILIFKISNTGAIALHSDSVPDQQSFSMASDITEGPAQTSSIKGDDKKTMLIEENNSTQPVARDIKTNTPLNTQKSEEINLDQTVSPETFIGDNLKSLADLNRVAISLDAVFIYVPREKESSIENQTATSLRAAQEALDKNRIKLGLYTLPSSSPDYPKLSKQIKPPGVLIICKGRGTQYVSDEITEPKLLQAFMAASRAGGCCSSGSSSSSGCK